MTRKYVVLGCGGFIGSHLLARLLEDERNHVTGWDADDHRLGGLLDRPNLVFHRRLLRDPEGDEAFLDAVREADAVIHLAAICTPAAYSTRPVDVIRANFIDSYGIVELCARLGTWLVFFSTSEVYGRTVASYLPGAHYADPALYELDEAHTPLVLGPIDRQRWTYACAKQLMERYVYAHHTQYDMPFTIVRPLNFFGPGMDFLPGVDGEGTPRVLACFMSALMRREPLKLVDGGTARRTIVSIHDAMQAVMCMLERPDRARNQVFNVGNRDNEVTIAELARRMRDIYAQASGDRSYLDVPIEAVPAHEFYGEGYEDCDRRMPNTDRCRERLGWVATTPLDTVLREAIEHHLANLPTISEAGT